MGEANVAFYVTDVNRFEFWQNDPIDWNLLVNSTLGNPFPGQMFYIVQLPEIVVLLVNAMQNQGALYAQVEVNNLADDGGSGDLRKLGWNNNSWFEFFLDPQSHAATSLGPDPNSAGRFKLDVDPRATKQLTYVSGEAGATFDNNGVGVTVNGFPLSVLAQLMNGFKDGLMCDINGLISESDGTYTFGSFSAFQVWNPKRSDRTFTPHKRH